MVTVHYFYDPMCGWCYGATALVEALAKRSDIRLIMHPGGMIKRREMSSEFRTMAHEHDANIAQLTGQKFSAAYRARLQRDEPIILDSFITATMVELAEQESGQGVGMLKAIQRAHYVDGLDVSSSDTLARLAQSLNIGKAIVDRSDTYDIQSTVTNSHRLMNQAHVRGFPTFMVERNNAFHRLEHVAYLGNLRGWTELIEQLPQNEQENVS